jgi:HK97 family phage portal protein
VAAIALKWKADRYSRPALRVSKPMRGAGKGKYEPLQEHALIDLWDRPNPHYTRRALEAGVGLSLDCYGTAYVQKVRDGAGRLKELWWLPTEWVAPVWPDDGSEFISGYEVQVDGAARYILPAKDVIQFRTGIDPRNPRLGLSALQAQLREVCTVNEASSYAAALLRNGAVPGLAIVPDSDMLRPSKTDADAIKSMIEDRFGGDNRGRSIVLAGKYKVQQVGFSPEQLTLDKLPQTAMACVAAATGVALMAMNLPDPGKTYSNIAEATRNSWGAVRAVQDVVAEALRWDLLPEFGDNPARCLVDYCYDDVPELQEGLNDKHLRVREDWKAGLIQLNEAREVLGFETDNDGDRFFPGTGGGEDMAGIDPATGLPMAPEPVEEDEEEPVPAALRNGAANGNGKAHHGWRY